MAPQQVGSNEKFKVAFCQTHTSKDKAVSLENAKAAMAKALGMGADIILLGEMFSCPYATKFFREYGERLAPPALQGLLDRAAKSPNEIAFEEVLKCIESAYTYRAVPFANGTVSSAAGENAGSAKVFSVGRLLGLGPEETLLLFGQHYRDVKDSPSGTSHANIRAFMQSGWAGIKFPEGLSLTPIETAHAQTVSMMSDFARSNKVWIVGGSVPELEGDKVFNTCLVFAPDGGISAKHRKAHLFDIDVAATDKRPAMKFKESDVLSAGEQLTLVDLPWCRAGVGICYDVRFPEYALALRQQGAKFLIFPGAFNMTTGPAHWTVLARGRAVDTQSYVALCSPARSTDPADYQAYGHSMLVSPWAEVATEAEHEPGVWISEVDPSEVDRIREQVPTSYQKRGDLYAPYAGLDGDAKRPRTKL
mmetsp:Transcript_31178/g.70882  ORF Transcript_31178/g.70882 Transcript_31178/m.70882 type:complete len:420 (+) Transcript_31178:88-1347(+)